MSPRAVRRLVEGLPTSDGAGVKLRRVIGQPLLDALDPFLLFDEFGSDDPKAYIAGFPPHPHRGFETVTYMLAGSMRHRDNRGHEGVIGPGAVQWMTAGRGIVHSEMPEQDRGLMRGFQLWVNLPAKDKMAPPRYQEFASGLIAEVRPAPGVAARVVAGEFAGAGGPVTEIAVRPLYLDLALEAGAGATVPVEDGHNAFAYVYEGAVETGGRFAEKGQLALYDRVGEVTAKAGPAGARLVLIAGRPIGEPVARHGPFVMNTRAELIQAFQDYESGRI
ncbi:MAG: pirin family protein [Alphaproteobacteria bacterium]|nr:pirin family protein [Alphaproteobacteria bacterium]